MDLWNITDLRQMGPVIDLILHKCIRGCKAPRHDIGNCSSSSYICLWLFKYTIFTVVAFLFYMFITPFLEAPHFSFISIHIFILFHNVKRDKLSVIKEYCS